MTLGDDWPLVRCCQCGDYIQVAPELIGDTDPQTIIGFVCGACDDEFYNREYDEMGAWFDDDTPEDSDNA